MEWNGIDKVREYFNSIVTNLFRHFENKKRQKYLNRKLNKRKQFQRSNIFGYIIVIKMGELVKLVIKIPIRNIATKNLHRIEIIGSNGQRRSEMFSRVNRHQNHFFKC